MRLIFRKKETARQNLNRKLNKKKRKENAKRKDSYFIERIATTSSTQKIQAKLENF